MEPSDYPFPSRLNSLLMSSYPWYTDAISEKNLIDYFGADHTLHVSRNHTYLSKKNT